MCFVQEEQKKELKAELDYEEAKAKRRSLGNIRYYQTNEKKNLSSLSDSKV